MHRSIGDDDHDDGNDDNDDGKNIDDDNGDDENIKMGDYSIVSQCMSLFL